MPGGNASRKRRKRRESAVERAGQLLKITKSGAAEMSVHDAMRFGGFNTVERSDRTYQRQVTRRRDKYLQRGESSTGRQLLPTFATVAAAPAATPAAEQPKRPVKLKVSSMRQSFKQAAEERRFNAVNKQKREVLFEKACVQWAEELQKKATAEEGGYKYKTISAETICAEINASKDAQSGGETLRIAPRSVRACVRDNRVKLKKRGVKGEISEVCYKALCAAVSSYMAISQASGTSNSVLRPRLVKLVNACVNKKEGLRSRNNRKLFERIEKEIANLNVGKPDRVEQRRNKWSTYDNLNLWFESFKGWLIDMGFATDVPPEDVDQKGELVWATEDQGCRIANMDETGLVLDTTDAGKGGRPAAAYYDPRLGVAPTMGAHKSSYHATMVSGSFASGEKFPEHFQLPTDAKELENEGFQIEFVEDMLSTHAVYLNKRGSYRTFSATYGVNEKGGMNHDDFAEYILRNFVPLVADDVADKPGKRVVLLVDGGPGRTNRELLMQLKMIGVYLFPCGPPNTTHILQVSRTVVCSELYLIIAGS